MRQVHVVILTAITLEYQAVKQVDAGVWEGSRWEEEKGPNGLPVAFRTFPRKTNLGDVIARHRLPHALQRSRNSLAARDA